MDALKDWPLEARRRVTGVLTNINDTLTTAGAITPDALAALSELKAAGLHVIAVTGRPAGASLLRFNGRSTRSSPKTARWLFLMI